MALYLCVICHIHPQQWSMQRIHLGSLQWGFLPELTALVFVPRFEEFENDHRGGNRDCAWPLPEIIQSVGTLVQHHRMLAIG
jgi:hypothetical protein